ncbi:hypothetical protein EJ04DRAFT_516255 [Polyplosphaeria fusca]|uniref:Uncharacterized protein n=1 Tax=Polyplosphaeria fusca TaxID=682080 RepID=A0A9P4UXH8_9PLEO|nr:hypothetical protein EJ04DRAFT_516255 [Polyplosphaeria fusca]
MLTPPPMQEQFVGGDADAVGSSGRLKTTMANDSGACRAARTELGHAPLSASSGELRDETGWAGHTSSSLGPIRRDIGNPPAAYSRCR